MRRYILLKESDTASGVPGSINFDYQKESNDLLFIVKYIKHSQKHKELFAKKLYQYRIKNRMDFEKSVKAGLSSGVGTGVAVSLATVLGVSIYAASKLIRGLGSVSANLAFAIVGAFISFVLWKVLMKMIRRESKQYQDILTSESTQLFMKKLNLETRLLCARLQQLSETTFLTEAEAAATADAVLTKAEKTGDKMVNQIEAAPKSFFQKYAKLIFFALLCVGCVILFMTMRSDAARVGMEKTTATGQSEYMKKYLQQTSDAANKTVTQAVDNAKQTITQATNAAKGSSGMASSATKLTSGPYVDVNAQRAGYLGMSRDAQLQRDIDRSVLKTVNTIGRGVEKASGKLANGPIGRMFRKAGKVGMDIHRGLGILPPK